MNKAKRARLEAKGWRIGSAADFLELTPEEAAFVETKLALTETLRERRYRPAPDPTFVGEAFEFESVADCQNGGRRFLCFSGPAFARVVRARRQAARHRECLAASQTRGCLDSARRTVRRSQLCYPSTVPPVLLGCVLLAVMTRPVLAQQLQQLTYKTHIEIRTLQADPGRFSAR